ncbi:MAG TPA: asparaginase [Vicinamibacteria bacterium]|nr:asparaginase [Vicinamibacteria bacterium]
MSLLSSLLLTALLLSQEPPHVHLLATGGTIAGGSGSSLKARDLMELLPELADVATVSVEDYSNIGSSRMTPELQFGLAQRVNELFATRRDLAGIVITHGTDSLEETAFLLDLLVPAGRPVVFAAAQRPARQSDTDGPRNLLNAIRLAAHPGVRDLGVLVTLNDEFHAARDVRKTHSIALNAFASPWVGPLGQVDSGQIYLFHRPARRLELSVARVEPAVALVSLVAGSDGSLIRHALESGAKGIVVEVFGRGNVPPEVAEAVGEAISKKVVVVYATRTGGGRVALGREATEMGVVSAEDLDGLKARLLLVAALGTTRDRATIQSYFRRLSGELTGLTEIN